MQARSRHPALDNGLLFGIALGVVEIILAFLLSGVGLIINVLLFLFIVGYAGYRASSRSGRVSTGLVAGLLVGLFSSVIACIPLLIYYLSNIDAFRVQLQKEMAASNLSQGFTLTNSLVITSVIVFLVIVVAGATLLGLGVGSIGGAIGKGQAQPPQVAQFPAAMPPYQPHQPHQPQAYVPHPPEAYKPIYPQGDYTSPETYILPQENPPPPQGGSGPSVSQE